MINAQSTDDNKCFKWCFVRYLDLADCNPARITKVDKDFAKRIDFKDIKFPVTIRQIRKIENKKSIGISVFGYENKEKHPIYQSVILKIALKLMLSKLLRCLKKVNMLNSKILKEK